MQFAMHNISQNMNIEILIRRSELRVLLIFFCLYNAITDEIIVKVLSFQFLFYWVFWVKLMKLFEYHKNIAHGVQAELKIMKYLA